ncbi:MAG: hypothetical protein MHMPM18_000979 [Marteilia pararefringens]
MPDEKNVDNLAFRYILREKNLDIGHPLVYSIPIALNESKKSLFCDFKDVPIYFPKIFFDNFASHFGARVDRFDKKELSYKYEDESETIISDPIEMIWPTEKPIQVRLAFDINKCDDADDAMKGQGVEEKAKFFINSVQKQVFNFNDFIQKADVNFCKMYIKKYNAQIRSDCDGMYKKLNKKLLKDLNDPEIVDDNQNNQELVSKNVIESKDAKSSGLFTFNPSEIIADSNVEWIKHEPKQSTILNSMSTSNKKGSARHKKKPKPAMNHMYKSLNNSANKISKIMELRTKFENEKKNLSSRMQARVFKPL